MPTDKNKNILKELNEISFNVEPITIKQTPQKLTVAITKPINNKIPKSYEIGMDCGVSDIFRELNKNEKTKVPMPKKYIINYGAVVLIWNNGEKTIVKRCEDDEFNKKLGFLTAFFQHYSGMSKNKANKFLAELEVEDEEIKTTKAKHMKGE